MSDQIDITFVVFAYNQQDLVAEAIASAFAQTFDGRMEILLSDDCSPDDTFAVMERMAADYQGPHEVVLNRNAQNMGAIFHVNRVFELARGRLIVVNAGDDVSYPQRTARLWERFCETDALMVYSALDVMDRHGVPTGRVIDADDRLVHQRLGIAATARSGCLGASCAWSRELYDIYGPMREPRAYGDLVSTWRAKLPGRLAHVAEPLLRYRMGGISDKSALNDAERLSYRRRRLDVHIAVLRQRLVDTRRGAPGRRGMVMRIKSALARAKQRKAEFHDAISMEEP